MEQGKVDQEKVDKWLTDVGGSTQMIVYEFLQELERIAIAPASLTQYRRSDLLAQAHDCFDRGRKNIRLRHGDAFLELNSWESNGRISKDDLARGKNGVEWLSEASHKNICDAIKRKQEEIDGAVALT